MGDLYSPQTLNKFMKNFLIFTLVFSFYSCALLHPNPNREEKLVASVGLVLKPFTTDYCSEWPDGRILDPDLWAGCCFTHDLNYWVGGTEEDRKIADIELKSCVKNYSDSLNSFLMYMGVRMGGDPGDASYSWGYGWTQDRKYFERSAEVKKLARDLLQASELNNKKKEKKLINKFLEKIKN